MHYISTVDMLGYLIESAPSRSKLNEQALGNIKRVRTSDTHSEARRAVGAGRVCLCVMNSAENDIPL